MKNTEVNRRPIFIGGCPRSGTTMLGSMLGSGDHCITTPESLFKQEIPRRLSVDWPVGINRREFISALTKNFEFKLWEIPLPVDSLPLILTKSDYRNLLFNLVDSYASTVNRSDWKVWVDHTPRNIIRPLMMLDIFPNARFISIVRDPRGAAASIITLDWGPNTARDVAKLWADRLLAILALESAFPDKCLRVKYEDLVLNPQKNLQAICDFSRIEFESSMVLGKGFKLPDYTKEQHKLVGKAPDVKRTDAWKRELTDQQIYQIERFLGDLLEMMDYTKIGVRPPPQTISHRVIWPARNEW